MRITSLVVAAGVGLSFLAGCGSREQQPPHPITVGNLMFCLAGREGFAVGSRGNELLKSARAVREVSLGHTTIVFGVASSPSEAAKLERSVAAGHPAGGPFRVANIVYFVEGGSRIDPSLRGHLVSCLG